MKSSHLLYIAAASLALQACNNSDVAVTSTPTPKLTMQAAGGSQPEPVVAQPAPEGFIKRPVSQPQKTVAKPAARTNDNVYQPLEETAPVVYTAAKQEEPTPAKEEKADAPVQSLYDYIAGQNTTRAQLSSVFGGIVTGKQGSEIMIPEDAFEMEDSTEYEGPIEVKFEEYFTKTDFILAGLSSVSEGKLIESSGMFNITVTTPEGKQLRLKKTKKLSLKLPATRRPKANTIMFYADHSVADAGATTAAGTPANPTYSFGWRAQNMSNAAPPQPTLVLTKAQQKKLKKIEDKRAFDVNFQNLFADSVSTRSNYKLIGMNMSAKEKRENNLLRYLEKSYKKYGYFQTKLSTAQNYRTLANMGELDTLKLSFYVDKKGRLVEVKAQAKKLDFDQLAQISKSFDGKKRFKMTEAHTRSAFYQMYFVKRSIAQFAFAAEFSVGQLGWINCDRFLKSDQPLIAMMTDRPEAPEEKYYCVFKSINSIMPAYFTEDNHYMFPNLPQGLPITIVGIKNSKSDTPEISITEGSTAEHITLKPFEPTTKEGLKDKLATTFGEKPASNAVTMAKP